MIRSVLSAAATGLLAVLGIFLLLSSLQPEHPAITLLENSGVAKRLLPHIDDRWLISVPDNETTVASHYYHERLGRKLGKGAVKDKDCRQLKGKYKHLNKCWKKGALAGVIIGSVIGGLLAIALLVVVISVIWKKCH